MQAKDLDQDGVDFARALSEGEAKAVLRFESRYRRVIRHAFGRAYARWRPEVPVEADDYVQDFIGFLFDDRGRRLRSFSGRARFSSWLYTVALRYFQRALSKLARDRRSNAVLSLLPDPSPNDPQRLAEMGQEHATLRQALGQLPEGDQLFVRLFYVERLNATEVARTLGKGTSAVRMRKMRILERLRELLGDHQDEGEA